MPSTGEGSRGGHVIGHTKSGKAIYAADKALTPAVLKGIRSTLEGYSSQDHRDAAMAHAQRRLDLQSTGRPELVRMHGDFMRLHDAATHVLEQQGK